MSLILWWCSILCCCLLDVKSSPLLITSNNPHEQPSPVMMAASSVNRAPVTEWEALYEKEIGTWCAPSEDGETSTTTSTESTTTTTIKAEGLIQQQRPAGWLLASSDPQIGSSNGEISGPLRRWVDAALRIIRNDYIMTTDPPCSESEDSESVISCKKKRSLLENRPLPSDMNLYVAMPSSNPTSASATGNGATSHVKLSAVLPDGPMTKTGPRDAWIVLDPTPHLSFGHTVYVFVVDLKMIDSNCITNGGVPLEGDDCLTQVFKNRCPNTMVRRSASWSPRRRSIMDSRSRCDIDFLPLVHLQNSAPVQAEQRLLCSDSLPGFAPCPSLRSWNETSELICDPLSTNHKRCDSTQEVVKTRCRLFETCDQAVLLSGGWNWQLSGKRELHHLLSMYRMFRRNGFGKHSIKIFFANGVRAGSDYHDEESEEDFKDPSGALFVPSSGDIQQQDDSGKHHHHHHRHHHQGNTHPAMYPAALKIALRNHIRTLCGTSHCVDSFVIYLSSPTRTSDGASLLWDADHNGEFDETEVYTVREFLRDIQDCVARQVVVVADQNHSGLLADALARSRRHSNVLMFTSSSQSTSATGELTRHWANYAHGHTCLSQVYKDSLKSVQYSKPRFEDSSNGTLVYNLFGAPCDVVPPYSLSELKSHYMGCQYVPTRIWLSRQGSATDPPPRLLTG